jgi:hypothetical protein
MTRAPRQRSLGALGRQVETIVVPVVFVLVTGGRLLLSLEGGWFGSDFSIYRAAAIAALDGRDPWLVTAAGLRFAGPPPSLLAYMPAALLPESVGAAIYLLIGAAAAVLVVRALRLPLWWVFFPPLAEAVMVINPETLVVFLLVCGGRLSGLSVGLKVYAAIPLLVQRRFAALALGAVACALTLPLWPTFIADAGLVAATLRSQSDSISAWNSLLLIPAVAALFAMRRTGGEWLIVPALWPYAQLHYAALALPALARRPMLAMALSFVPLFAPVAIIAQAAWEYARRRWDERRPATDSQFARGAA